MSSALDAIVEHYIQTSAVNNTTLYELEVTVKGLESIVRLNNLQIPKHSFDHSMLSSLFSMQFYCAAITEYIVGMINAIYDNILKL